MTYRECLTKFESVSLHNIRQEGDNRHQNRCAGPESVEHDTVDARWEVDLMSVLSRRFPALKHTLDHPLHFVLSGIQCTSDPALLPCEELDEFDLNMMSGMATLCIIVRPTALINSLSTPIRLSLAARTPFWMRMLLRAMKLFRGHPRMRTEKPANALQPRSWYRNTLAIMTSKGALIWIHALVSCTKERRGRRTPVNEVK